MIEIYYSQISEKVIRFFEENSGFYLGIGIAMPGAVIIIPGKGQIDI